MLRDFLVPPLLLGWLDVDQCSSAAVLLSYCAFSGFTCKSVVRFFLIFLLISVSYFSWRLFFSWHH